MIWRQRHPKGARKAPGEMNKVEAAYAKHLEERRYVGTVLWYAFEAIKFRLADKTFFTPDFLVMLSDDTLEIHEVKGSKRIKETGETKPWVEEDAAIKIKVAAEQFPFKFRMMFLDREKGWLSRDY